MPTFRRLSRMRSCGRIRWWIELEVGLDDAQRLIRRPPITLIDAARKLAEQTGRESERCERQIQAMLILMSKPANERGGVGDRAFMAFKLHQFFSGAGRLYATLRAPGQRKVTLDGQLFDPEDTEVRDRVPRSGVGAAVVSRSPAGLAGVVRLPPQRAA